MELVQNNMTTLQVRIK